MPRNPSLRPPNPQNRTPSPFPPPPQPYPPPSPPSPSSFPNTLPLPLNWTEAECFILSCHMYQNREDSDDSISWWQRISPFFPHKTLQELRLFNHNYTQSYEDLAADRGWITRAELNQLEINGPGIKAIQPSKQECQTLLETVEQNPDMLTEKGAWKMLAIQFPGKKTSEIWRSMCLIRMSALIMGKLNELKRLLVQQESVSEEAEEEAVDMQASTSNADDEPEYVVISDEKICVRPKVDLYEDCEPSTSGRDSSRARSPTRRRSSRRR